MRSIDSEILEGSFSAPEYETMLAPNPTLTGAVIGTTYLDCPPSNDGRVADRSIDNDRGRAEARSLRAYKRHLTVSRSEINIIFRCCR